MLALFVWGALLGATPPPVADAEIDRWLLEVEPHRGRVALWPGRTVAVEKLIDVKGILGADALDAQLQITAAPGGVHLEPEPDLLSAEPAPTGGKVRLRYVVWGDAQLEGGWLRFTILVTKRRGLGDLVVKETIELGIDRVEAEPRAGELAADFWGYRREKATGAKLQSRLASEGITASPDGRYPSIPAALAPVALAYGRARRRVEAGKRALEYASRRDSPEGKEALDWLANLDRDAELAAPPPAATSNNELAIDRDDPFGRRRRVRPPIPVYRRALTLDDPELSYSAAVRVNRARSRSRGRAATVVGLDYSAGASITAGLGVEVLVPTVLVQLDLEEVESVYALGNPLVTAKYRFYLAPLYGRRPLFTARARWGIPVSGRYPVPRLPLLSAGDLGRATTIQQPWTLAVEHTTLGLGGNAAWQYDIYSLQLQLAADYFVPAVRGSATSRFLAVTSGLSVGAHPFGDVVGFFAESRLTSLTAGPVRNELSIYLGARGRWFGFLEPAVYVGYPFGSVERVSGLSLAIDFRVAYDVPETEEREVRQSSDLLGTMTGESP